MLLCCQEFGDIEDLCVVLLCCQEFGDSECVVLSGVWGH